MKKKILFIIPSLGGGGAEKVLIDILRAFDYNKFAVDLFVIHHIGIHLNEIPEHVDRIYSFFYKWNLFYRTIYKGLRIINLFDKYREIKTNILLKNCSYNTIISFTEEESIKFHSFILNKGVKNISWIHADFMTNHTFSLYFKSKKDELLVYKKMDEIIFVSKNVLNNFNKYFNIEKTTIKERVINNYLDPDNIKNLSTAFLVPHNCITICTVGRLQPVKGYDRLLRVGKMLKDKDYNFIIKIVGCGYMEEELKKLASSLNISDIIEFTGYKTNPYPYIKNSNIYICTSLSESFNMAMFESMCLGIPVVSTRTASELVSDNIVITEHNDLSICKGLQLLLDSEEKRIEYSKKSLNEAGKYNLSKIMDDIYSVIS
ncbi:MAG: glycosyltransferase [Prolixibacteraceae bacterium]|nr:glycosyltransferase [Prolixibacteraceae bacterium]